MARPKGTEKITVPARLSPEVLAKIDEMISDGRFSSRSDWLTQAAHWFLNQEECEKRLSTLVQKELASGASRQVMEDVMREIVKDTLIDTFSLKKK